MNKTENVEVIRATGIVAIMRADNHHQLFEAARAILEGGVRAIEVTMTTPGALELIGEVKSRMSGEIVFGAGSVTDAITARMAIVAGADFIVAPTVDIETIELCSSYGVVVIPGAFSPTEAIVAQRAGADMVKLFPAQFGGPALVSAILAPLPQLQLIPVGGVNLSNASEYISKGAAALGVGGSLVDQKLLDEGDMKELTRRAAAFIEAVVAGRSDVR